MGFKGVKIILACFRGDKIRSHLSRLMTTNKIACAPGEDSDQPWHPASLIRVVAIRMKKAWVLNYLLSAQPDQTGRIPG